LKNVGELRDQAKDLEEVKLEEIYEKLKRGDTVLVETEDEAVVLPHDEVWPWRTDRNAPAPPDGDPRDFAGEQAISSAILRMTQKEKTAVVFTRYGGRPLLRADYQPGRPMDMQQAPYQALNELLQKENFITEEWDVRTDENPPGVEDAARTIYVVFPPEPPQQQNPMRPSPTTPRISDEQKQRIFDAVEESGMAVFLTRWAPPSVPYAPVPEKYEFSDYLKSNWGIEVKDTHLALEFTPNPQREGLWYVASRSPTVSSRVFHFTDHPISEPLQGLPAAFQAVAPLAKVGDEDKPEDVTVEAVVEVDDTEDVWAINDVQQLNEDFKKRQGTRRYDEDIAAPFPLALAATDADGDRLVVFGSERFMADAIVNMSQLVMVGGALRLAKLYPGNIELFVNALHWLTDNADRIAVGPRRGDVPRLEGLKDDATLTFTRVFLVGIWPGLALVVGLGVWLIRRR
jgi:hypothetical protein